MEVLVHRRSPCIDDGVSTREVEILKLTSEGFSFQDIADLLHISRETVKSHRRNLLITLNAKNAAHLVRKAIELRIIEL